MKKICKRFSQDLWRLVICVLFAVENWTQFFNIHPCCASLFCNIWQLANRSSNEFLEWDLFEDSQIRYMHTEHVFFSACIKFCFRLSLVSFFFFFFGEAETSLKPSFLRLWSIRTKWYFCAKSYQERNFKAHLQTQQTPKQNLHKRLFANSFRVRMRSGVWGSYYFRAFLYL